MQALILSLLLCLLLDQNDRSQRIAGALGVAPDLAGPGAVGVLMASIALAALLVPAAGALLAPKMAASPRLLFFSLALIFGGIGMLMPLRTRGIIRFAAMDRTPLLIIRLFLARLTDRASFAVLGVAVLTGEVVLTAIGAMIGSLAALLPSLWLGSRYARVIPLNLIGWFGGAALLLAGVFCALSALSLL